MDEIKILRDAQEELSMCPTLNFEDWAPAWMVEKDDNYKDDEELKGKLKVIFDKARMLEAVRRGIIKMSLLSSRESYGYNVSGDIVVDLRSPLCISMNRLMGLATQIGAKDATIDAKESCHYSIIFKMK